MICCIAVTRRLNIGPSLEKDTTKKAKKGILLKKLSDVNKRKIIKIDVRIMKKYSKNILGKKDKVNIEVKALKYF